MNLCSKIILLLSMTSSMMNRFIVGLKSDAPLEFSDILPENPKDYDKMQPPKEEGKPTIVYFHVTVMSLDSIDESSMTYAADIFFSQMWNDKRLRFPDNLTAEYRLLPTSWLGRMWRPDSFFKNAKKVTFQDVTIPNHYIWLYKDKSILYMVKLTLILSCSMNFKLYPHDTQQCAMKIESLSHTTDDLVFVWESKVPLAVDERIQLPQLDVVSNVTGDCTQLYSTGNFTCLEVVFTLRRRLGYYLFHTYVPTCLIVIMSWISFWIRPEAVPARVTLGVTSLLTLSTQHANSQKSLPPVSYIKAIDVFMSGCTVFVFCSLMEYALVNIVMGDVIEGDESALKRGMKSIFMATRFISSKQPQPPPQQQQQQQQILRVSSTTLPSCSHSTPRSFNCQHEHHAQVHQITNSNITEQPQQQQLPRPQQQEQTESLLLKHSANINPAINDILPDPQHSNGGGSSSQCAENGRLQTLPVLCGSKSNTISTSTNLRRSAINASTSQTLLQLRRSRAIFIDRFSRVFFPVSFALLNIIYWSIFVEWN